MSMDDPKQTDRNESSMVENRSGRDSAEECLRHGEARFRALVETTADWIWEINEYDVYIYSSPKIKDFLGYEPEEVVGITLFDLMSPEDALRLKEAFRPIKDGQKPFYRLEHTNLHKNGNSVICETSGVPVFDKDGRFTGYRGIDRNITDRKKLEEKFLQSQKMEAIGQLAGGVAHDFNNILTALIGYNHLLLPRLASDPKGRHYAEQIATLSESASVLTQELLSFSRKRAVHPKPADLNEIIKTTSKFLKRLIGEDIELKVLTEEAQYGLPVVVVASQIEQVLMNLATNARDAMPHGGLLTVETSSVDLDADFIKANGYGEIGKYARICFSDNGMGMDERTKLKLFEPFFTTKELGKGTGLGLATAYGIIRQHDGYINVYSELGEGTTFRIYLPLAQIGLEEQDEFTEYAAISGGTETVLLVEDEQSVREFIRVLLGEHGYKVIEALDGDDALDMFEAYEADIDVIITDVIMPKRSGKAMYDVICNTHPGMKVLFISGYTADIIENKGIEDRFSFVTKPLSPNNFLKVLRKVLDGNSKTGK